MPVQTSHNAPFFSKSFTGLKNKVQSDFVKRKSRFSSACFPARTKQLLKPFTIELRRNRQANNSIFQTTSTPKGDLTRTPTQNTVPSPFLFPHSIFPRLLKSRRTRRHRPTQYKKPRLKNRGFTSITFTSITYPAVGGITSATIAFSSSFPWPCNRI